jgi:hypothetical protein
MPITPIKIHFGQHNNTQKGQVEYPSMTDEDENARQRNENEMMPAMRPLSSPLITAFHNLYWQLFSPQVLQQDIEHREYSGDRSGELAPFDEGDALQEELPVERQRRCYIYEQCDDCSIEPAEQCCQNDRGSK